MALVFPRPNSVYGHSSSDAGSTSGFNPINRPNQSSDDEDGEQLDSVTPINKGKQVRTPLALTNTPTQGSPSPTPTPGTPIPSGPKRSPNPEKSSDSKGRDERAMRQSGNK
ncbi:hypothetical protein NHQ30_009456 [Ciborinia camelliae]|nr:hypothetical protein NHQ30_009456 [Ciborinia camelliae]